LRFGEHRVLGKQVLEGFRLKDTIRAIDSTGYNPKGGPKESVDQDSEVGIFRYSSRRDFMNMMASEKYQAMMHFKLASMGWIAIVPSQPHDLMFNPMPNTPVLLGFVFIIGYLIVLLLSTRRKNDP
jgi:hypothetical protein